MKITILQSDIVWQDFASNIISAGVAIESNPGADLYILPEMFATGFCTVPSELPPNSGEFILNWMVETSAKHSVALAGSVIVEDKGKFYNRLYFVKPDGTYSKYDKRHLFTYGGEDRFYTAGEERVVVEYMGVRILLGVCYDLRFPVWSRNRKDYDLIIYVANWPVTRSFVWSSLLVARAIENQCYVAGVNRVGEDPQCRYSGGSVVIDPYGRRVADCGDSISAATASIDLDMVGDFRKKFPVLDDADNFELI